MKTRLHSVGLPAEAEKPGPVAWNALAVFPLGAESKAASFGAVHVAPLLPGDTKRDQPALVEQRQQQVQRNHQAVQSAYKAHRDPNNHNK